MHAYLINCPYRSITMQIVLNATNFVTILMHVNYVQNEGLHKTI